jgi:aconitate hydratase
LQDATGTLVQLELEAMGLKKAKTEVAVQYVDHNLLQTDSKNADDHLFYFRLHKNLVFGNTSRKW